MLFPSQMTFSAACEPRPQIALFPVGKIPADGASDADQALKNAGPFNAEVTTDGVSRPSDLKGEDLGTGGTEPNHRPKKTQLRVAKSQQAARVVDMRKPLRIAAVAVAVLLLGVGLGLTLFLDGLVKAAVERVGPSVTGVTVEVRKVSVSLWTGQGRIEGLLVGNPEGYKSPHAIRLEKASLALVPASLWSDKLHLRSIEVDSPEITVELGPGGNNLRTILAHVEGAVQTETQPHAPGDPSRAGRKLQVDRIVIKNASFRLGATALGGTIPVRLPDIHLENLGTGPEGISAAELTRKVMAALVEGTTQAVQQAVGTLGKEAGRSIQTLGKEAAEAAGKATKGLGDLFKKKD